MSNAPEHASASSLSQLIDRLLQHHHPYTRSALESLAPLLDKVQRVHGDSHPELHELAKLFRELHSDMDMHLMKEEHILFPYMQSLENGANPPAPHFGTVANPIRMMTMEHQQDSLILHKMQEVTGHFTTPPGACGSYASLYAGLQDLVNDLFQHIQLENDFLFPQAIATETALLARS